MKFIIFQNIEPQNFCQNTALQFFPKKEPQIFGFTCSSYDLHPKLSHKLPSHSKKRAPFLAAMCLSAFTEHFHKGVLGQTGRLKRSILLLALVRLLHGKSDGKQWERFSSDTSVFSVYSISLASWFNLPNGNMSFACSLRINMSTRTFMLSENHDTQLLVMLPITKHILQQRTRIGACSRWQQCAVYHVFHGFVSTAQKSIFPTTIDIAAHELFSGSILSQP